LYKRIQKAGKADTLGITQRRQIAGKATRKGAAIHYCEENLMKLLRIAIAAAALASALLAYWPAAWTTASAQETTVSQAPEFTGADRWYNSPPLTMAGLRGKVILVEFWTRECINCIDVLPHTKALYDKYAKDGLVVVGVHTPEYDEERDPVALQLALRQLHVTWPVAVDNESRIWNAYGNRYWPAVYLIDQQGRVVYSHVGEGNYDETEQHVRQLLGQAQ
jgi:thiol-disulfide isomerase/thioredoxin